MLAVGFIAALLTLFAAASADAAAAATGATDVSASSNQTCAIYAGKAWCWGENYYGQLGDGTTTNRSIPVKVTIPGDPVVTQISVGLWLTCAVDQTGKVWCWGRGDYGALGNGQTGAEYKSVVPVQAAFAQPTPTITQVAVGAWHACAIDSNGGIWCWGLGGNGRMGDGGSNDALIPVQSISAGATAISANNNHTCAVIAGAVKCWGYGGGVGRLGVGDTTDRNVPTNVDHPALQSGALGVSAGKDYSCAIASNHQAYCWGYNGSQLNGCSYLVACGGQLGDGTWDSRTSPVAVSSFAGYGNSAAQIAAGQRFHTCGISTSGNVFCWGTSFNGELGTGRADQQLHPAAVPVGGATAITTGESHSCAIAQGAVKCWGVNHLGQLGDGSGLNQMSPTNALAPPTVAIDAPGDESSTEDQQIDVQFSKTGNPSPSCTVDDLPATSPFSADLAVGANTITVVCSNSVGSSSATISVRRNEAPTVSIEAPLDGSTTSAQSAAITFSTTGYPAPTCTMNGDAGVSGSSVSLDVGPNTISVVCGNTAGVGSASITVSRLTAPTVTITTPDDGHETTDADASVEFQTTGYLAPTCKVAGVAATSPATVTLEPGENTIEVECENATGTASSAVVITRNVLPVVSIDEPLDGAVTTDETVAVRFTADGTPTPNCTVGGEPSAAGHRDVALAPGVNTIDVTCSNAAGSASQTVNVTRNTMPAATITTPIDGLQTSDTAISIAFIATGHPAPTCRINGAPAASPHPLGLAIGPNAVVLVCENAAGSVSRSITVTRVQLLPPAITSAPKSIRAGKAIHVGVACASSCRISPNLRIGKVRIKRIKSVEVRAEAGDAKIKLPAKVVKRIRKALEKNRRTKVVLTLSIKSAEGSGKPRRVRIR
jgi:alpha-tubulin suppressor-like RCC1 family protein